MTTISAISSKLAPGRGKLACDGASYLKVALPNLFAKIGTTFGSDDSLHFNVPLLTDKNRYLRAAGGSLAAGTSQSNQDAAHTHSGATFSATTGTQSSDHTHTFAGATGTETSHIRIAVASTVRKTYF